MADNVQLDAATTQGAVVHTYFDGTVHHPPAVVEFVGGGSAGNWTLQQVDATHGLPTAVVAALPAGSNTIGNVVLAAGSATIGTVNLGTLNGIALDATLAKLNVAQGATLGSNTGPLAQGSVTTAAPTYTTGQVNPLSLTTAGALRVDGSATTQPVSGTVTVQQATATNLKVDLSGTAANATAIKVDGSAVTQPVSGTFWQATQPVSGTVTANAGTGTMAVGGNVASGSADSGNPVKVGGVFNTSAPTLTNGQRGDAQLDSSGNLCVNVKAGGGSGGTSSSFAAAFPATGTAIGATDGTDMRALQVDGSGNLKVNVVTGGGAGSNAAASATGSAVPADADYQGVNVAGTLRGQTGVNPSGSVYAAQTDLSSVAGATADTNSGNKSAGTLRVVLATDQPALTNALKVDGSAVTQPVSGTVTGNQGAANTLANGWPVKVTDGTNTMPTGDASARSIHTTVDNSTLAVTQSGTWTNATNADAAIGAGTAPGKSLVAGGVYNSTQPSPTTGQTMALQLDAKGNLRTDLMKVGGADLTLGQQTSTNSLPVVLANDYSGLAVTFGGDGSMYLKVSASGTNAAVVKNGSGYVTGVQIANVSASPRYVKFYDKATAPTVGTDTPVKVLIVPGNSSGAGSNVTFPAERFPFFSSGIAIAITGGMANSDTTAIGANEVALNVDYF